MAKDSENVVTLSESYRRKQCFHERLPEEGAAMIGFAQLQLAQARRGYFKNYADCLRRLEAACTKLIEERKKGVHACVEPSRKELIDFMEETKELITFLQATGKKLEMPALHCLGEASFTTGRLEASLTELSKVRERDTRNSGYDFGKIRGGLQVLRETLSPILPSASTTPPPAYTL